ncbi:MAG TPA: alpha/beta fold hydrolase [Longimicrobiales bacterium]|nr:alpha/beta fold hydrolase [Longimicrobiales bacterium]
MHLVVAAAGVVATGGLWALDRVANAVVRPVPRQPDVTVPELGIRHEDLTIPAGGHDLLGWLLCPGDAGDRPLVMLAHGWGANYGTLLQLAEPLVVAGYPVLLFDVQGHGRNDPAPYVTVRHFRDDVMAAVRFASGRFPRRKRVLVGHSLGGAAAVLAAAAGADVSGIALVAAPANVLEVTADYLRERRLPGGFMVVALRPFWWARIGGTFRHLIPERKIAAVRQPILLIHPENDRRVGLDHARRLEAASGVPLHVIPGAGHTNVLGHAETHGRLLAFLEEVRAGAWGEGRESPVSLTGSPAPVRSPTTPR